MKFVCNWLDSIFIICIISSWLILLNVSFSIYLTDPFVDHAAEFYFYLDDNYFCWQWGKNNIIDIICFWCLFDHRCTVSLNCFYSFFLVTCCTATLHFQIQWSFYFDFSFIGKPLSFSFHFLTILVILVCHWSSFWADSFWYLIQPFLFALSFDFNIFLFYVELNNGIVLWFLLIKSFGLLFLFLKSIPVGFNFSIDTHVPAKHSVSFIFLSIMEAYFLCKSLKILQYEV